MRGKRILIFHTFGIGDMIMFTPALELLSRHFPTASFDFLIGYPPAAEIIRGYPNTQNVFFLKKGAKIVSQIYDLRQRRYDYVLVTSGHNEYKSALFTKLLSAGCTIGDYDGVFCPFDKGVRRATNFHRINNNLQLVKELTEDNSSEPITPRVWLGEKLSIAEDKNLKAITESGKIIFGFHCGSRTSQAYKRWPGEYYLKLMDLINNRYKNSLFLIIGSEAEEETATFLYNNSNCNREIIIDKPLPVVAELIRHCRLMIANDSGLGHLSAALGTPTLSIFGPTNPDNCTPVGNDCRSLRGLHFCSPCYMTGVPSKCRKQAECMVALKPETVFDTIISMLEGKKSTGEI